MAAAPTAGAVPTTRQRTVVFPAFDDANDANESALDRLIRHWMNERHSPDILPAQEDLLNDILNHVSRQVSMRFAETKALAQRQSLMEGVGGGLGNLARFISPTLSISCVETPNCQRTSICASR